MNGIIGWKLVKGELMPITIDEAEKKLNQPREVKPHVA